MPCGCALQYLISLVSRAIRSSLHKLASFPGSSVGTRLCIYCPAGDKNWRRGRPGNEAACIPAVMSRLSENEKSYYKRVEAFLVSESDGEDKLFLSNVVRQILSDGARRVCSDKDGSRVVQAVVESSHVDAPSLRMLLKALDGEHRNLATDRCGSHVIESLVRASAQVLTASDSDTLQAQFFTLCTVLTAHLPELIAHSYGSHVLSAMLQALAGMYVSDNFSRSRYSQEFRKAKMASTASSTTAVLPWKQKGGIQIERKVAVPDSFSKHLKSVGKAICKLPSLLALLTHRCASPVLQVALKTLTERLPTRGRKLARKIVRCPGVLRQESEGTLPSLFTDAVGSHLMEAVIAVSSPSLLQHMFDTCFRERLVVFALHPVANYPLQQIVAMATPPQVRGVPAWSLTSPVFIQLPRQHIRMLMSLL